MLTNANKMYYNIHKANKVQCTLKKVWCTLRRNTYTNIIMDS